MCVNIVFTHGEDELSSRLKTERIVNNKSCKFKFEKVSISTVEKLLQESEKTLSGVDNLDMNLLKHVAELIAIPISHIINLN